MKDYIAERVRELAAYILSSGATVRQAAKIHNVSKSTVHKDVTERLIELDPAMAAEIKKILDVNLSERHIRGGIATQKKYRNEQND